MYEKRMHSTGSFIDDIVCFPPGSVERVEEWCFSFGNYANIWRAKFLSHDVAVKVWRNIPNDMTSRVNFVKSMLKELRKSQHIRHTNIVPCLGIVTDYGDIPAVVLPYYRNRTAVEYMKLNPSVPVLPLLIDVAAALNYLHHLHIPVIHGAVKGSNIIINDQGQAMLTDIGHKLIVSDANLTAVDGMSSESCRWMAPELLLSSTVSSNTHTTYTDIYGFAMTALELYTNDHPFSHRRKFVSVVVDIMHGLRPPRPSPENNISDSVWDLIQDCWAENPLDRPDANALFLRLMSSF